MPPLCVIVELFCNQLLFSWKHLPLQYLFTLAYAFMTVVYQEFTGKDFIFPNTLNWEADNIFTDCLAWFLVFMVVQTACFAVLLAIHFLKAKFICKQTVEIKAYKDADGNPVAAKLD